MELQLLLAYYYATSFLVLIVLGNAQTTSFMPPASTTCLAANFATGGDFLDCCPSADPNDGICTLIWCIQPNTLTVRDNCNCGQVETACDQLSMFAGVVDGLSEACTAMKGCCEAGVTSNDDFASCTEDAVAMSNITIPDISGLVPGGVPDLDSVAAAGATTTTTETTIAAEEAGGETTATTTTAVPVTTAPETEATTPVLTGADKGTTSSSSAAASGKNVFDKVALAISLIGTSSVATLLLFV
jgi:hypothetical protein